MGSRPQSSSPNNPEISAFRCNRISGHDAVADQLATGLSYHDSQKKGGEDKFNADPPEEALEAVLSAVKKRKRMSSPTPVVSENWNRSSRAASGSGSEAIH